MTVDREPSPDCINCHRNNGASTCSVYRRQTTSRPGHSGVIKRRNAPNVTHCCGFKIIRIDLLVFFRLAPTYLDQAELTAQRVGERFLCWKMSQRYQFDSTQKGTADELYSIVLL